VIRSAFGFGEALAVVPLLALLMPVEVAAPLAVLVSITVAGIVVAQDRQHVQLRSAAWLVVSTLFGIPLGLLLLKTVAEGVVKALLAVVIIAFSLWRGCSVSGPASWAGPRDERSTAGLRRPAPLAAPSISGRLCKAISCRPAWWGWPATG
jgi:uncharacterized membrane protein YfcA